MHFIILCLKTSLMKLIKNVQNVTSLVANKKQEPPVRSYFYLLFHCLTSCSWHTKSLNKIYYWEFFHETVATAFKSWIRHWGESTERAGDWSFADFCIAVSCQSIFKATPKYVHKCFMVLIVEVLIVMIFLKGFNNAYKCFVSSNA